MSLFRIVFPGIKNANQPTSRWSLPEKKIVDFETSNEKVDLRHLMMLNALVSMVALNL